MKIGIVGGGPAGLYFALLMKKLDPSHQVTVVEQNPAGATYGWGVVFSDRALSFLKESDLESYADVEAALKTWDDQTIIHKSQAVKIDGSGYSGISRLTLLHILQEHCRRHGVDMHFAMRLPDASRFDDCDVIVGADGVNSVVRQQYAGQFQPSMSLLSNKYIWYGTHQLFDTLSLIFRRYQDGAFVAHCYPYSTDTSTFIVECDAHTWERAGFAHMSEQESIDYCQRVFAEDLGGHTLLPNKPAWMNFRVVANQHWSYQNVILLGDALRTVHFSIGSGTRMALEDAITLSKAFAATDDVRAALQTFEDLRRPGMEKLLHIARQSYTWYETFHEKMDLDPFALAYSYMTRSGRLDAHTLRQKAPRFMTAYDAYTTTRIMTTLDGVTPYPPEFAERYRALGYWEGRTLGQWFDETCARFSERVALVANAEQITYRQLAERVERLALHLLEFGLRPLDRFVMQLPNIPEFVYLYFALQKVGVIPIMALAPHRYTEIEQFVRLSEAVGYAIPERLGDFSFTELAMRVQQEHQCLRSVFVVGQTEQPGWVSLTKLVQTESRLPRQRLDEIEVDPQLPALFQLSGGTTGVPKLIPRTHNDYLYNSKAAAAINDIHADDALLVVLPISHNFPLASPGLQGFLMHGARIVLSTSTRPADLFNCIAQEHITHLELVPTLLIRMLSDPAFNDFDLSSLRVINTGGQKLQAEVKRRAEGMIPTCKVQEVFGMAEGLLCYVRLDDPDELRYETAGRPVSAGDELRLVDEQGNEVPDGEIGELLVRGPYTLRGYYRVPDYNARVFTADGFYKSGDLMRRHPSGNYIVEGRKKDLINRGGEKISAEEVENLILAHPAILNVACVPMPDPQLGERMCAFVVLRPGMALTLKELTNFLLEKDIARFKLPERLEVLEELPLSRFGKVMKQALIEQAKALVAKSPSGQKP